MPSNSLDIRWSLLDAGIPHIEFWHPADIPANIIRLYHGIQNNVPSRRIIKTTLRTKSAGNEYNFRNVGYSQEMFNVNVVLATKAEAREFTNFFKYVIKGSSGVFYYRNNFNGQEDFVRLMGKQLNMGEAEGAPYSFSLLLKKERPYAGGSLIMKWKLILSTFIPFITMFMGHSSHTSFVVQRVNSLALYASGNSQNGEHGGGYYDVINTFDRIGVGTDWGEDIAVGGGHTLAIKENGDLYVTGQNTYGELGLGDTTKRNVWAKLGSDTWISAAAGGDSSVGVKADGTLWVWGRNNSGQLGSGTTDSDPHSTPIQLGTDTDWTTVSAGWAHIIAIKSDGTLWAFGLNDKGQGGQDDDLPLYLTPTQIGTDTDWSTIACGASNGFAIKDNGTLWGWGWNQYGALGVGSIFNKVFEPQQVGVGSWISVASGEHATTGIMSDGTLWAWGNNVYGQLGQGTTDSSWHTTPTQIGTNTDWVKTVHSYQACMTINDSLDLYAWGHNSWGELGLGHWSVVTIPTLTFQPPQNSLELKWVIEG